MPCRTRQDLVAAGPQARGEVRSSISASAGTHGRAQIAPASSECCPRRCVVMSNWRRSLSEQRGRSEPTHTCNAGGSGAHIGPDGSIPSHDRPAVGRNRRIVSRRSLPVGRHELCPRTHSGRYTARTVGQTRVLSPMAFDHPPAWPSCARLSLSISCCYLISPVTGAGARQYPFAPLIQSASSQYVGTKASQQTSRTPYPPSDQHGSIPSVDLGLASSGTSPSMARSSASSCAPTDTTPSRVVSASRRTPGEVPELTEREARQGFER